MKLDVNVIDVTGSKSYPASLPSDAPCVRIIEQLIPKIGLPTVGPDGAPQAYSFHHKRTGRQLSDNQTLDEVGCVSGDTLRLMPTISAGL